jgi:FG-GAP-like repeat/ASPIC and UnbV
MLLCSGCDKPVKHEDSNTASSIVAENVEPAGKASASTPNISSQKQSEAADRPKVEVSADDAANKVDRDDHGLFRWWKETGIEFTRNDDMRGLKRIFESTGGGVGVIDFDRDGWPDLCFTGGCQVPEQLDSTEPTCGLFRNRLTTHSKFVDCTLSAKLIQSGFCQGVTVGDYDNDGFDDVYITALGSNGLFHNLGDGSFENLTSQLQVDDDRWSTGCAWADVNQDGVLDLYVVNYLADSPRSPLLCENPRSPSGYEQCPPSKYQGVNDRLFLGNGHGGFIDVTQQCGLQAKVGKGLGVLISDLDNEGLPEIYVANDGQANFLFKLNLDDQLGLQLEDIGMVSGAALSRAGYAQASMGIAAGDYDNDADIDLHITNFYGDSNTLYQNQGNLQFEDITRSTGLAGPSRNVLGWGTLMLDYDADGRLDLFVANGHVEDRTWNGRGEPFQMLPQLFQNVGGGKFIESSAKGGSYFKEAWLGRGVAITDLNRDRQPDLVISHQLAAPGILLRQNQTTLPVVVELVGTSSNRNALGATISILTATGQLRAFREMSAGTSFQSSQEHKFFLLGQSSDTLNIRWPTGTIQIREFPVTDHEIIVEP